MKEHEARIDNGKHELLLYVEKSDGTYGPLRTGAFMATKYMDDFVAKRKNLENEGLEKLRTGEVSAVGYYMLLRDMTVADVAARVGVPRFKVRRHMVPRGLGKVRLETLARYAEVFGVGLASMVQLVVPAEQGISLKTSRTGNRYMSIMEVSGRAE